MSEIEVASDLYLLLAALGLALSVDYAGLPLLGQSAFVAIGASARVACQHGVPLLAAVVISIVTAAVAGFAVAAGAAGWPVRRSRSQRGHLPGSPCRCS